MSTVSQRTKNEVVEYIQSHSINGKLQRSLIDIAEDIGFSNATVHRALKKLQQDGKIRIIAADKPTEPNTIIYQGSYNDDAKAINSSIAKAEQMLELAKELASDFRGLANKMEVLQRDVKMYKDLQSRIESIQDLPDGKYQMILVQKQ